VKWTDIIKSNYFITANITDLYNLLDIFTTVMFLMKLNYFITFNKYNLLS